MDDTFCRACRLTVGGGGDSDPRRAVLPVVGNSAPANHGGGPLSCMHGARSRPHHRLAHGHAAGGERTLNAESTLRSMLRSS